MRDSHAILVSKIKNVTCTLFTFEWWLVNVYISEGFSMLSYLLLYIYQKMRSSCINLYIYRTLSFTVHVLLTYMNFFWSNQNMQMANAYLYCKVKYVRRTSPSRRLHGKQLNYPSYLSRTLKYDMVLPINFYLVRKKNMNTSIYKKQNTGF